MSSSYPVTITLLSFCIIGISILIYRAKNKINKIHPATSQIPEQENRLKYYKCPGRDINQATKTGLATAGFVKGMDPASSELYIPCSYNYIEQELAKLSPGPGVRYIYAIKGCDQLCSKNDLWSALKMQYGRDLASNIMPLTWVLNDPAEYKEFQRYYLQYKSVRPTFILKKNIQGKRGLHITQDIAEITDIRDSDDFKVVQRYVDNSYCIQGYKLNIRLYVVIICHRGMVDWYLYNRGKCIYTNKKYDPELSLLGSNLTDKEQHFTSYNLDTAEKYGQYALPESLDDLANWMGKQAFDSVWNQIQARLAQVKVCYAGKLCMLDTLDEQVCFQLFGLDFILREQKPGNDTAVPRNSKLTLSGRFSTPHGMGVDAGINLEPLLLEFNKGPEMIYKSPGDKVLKTGLISNMLDMVLKRQGVTESGFLLIG